MAIKLLKQVNFGQSEGGLSTVGFTMIDGDGVVTSLRSTAGVHEVGVSTGIYAAQITFATQFSGSILWDTAGTPIAYAAEQYNPTAENVEFIKDIEGGRWVIDSTSNQMVFYKSDNATEVARFGLSGSSGLPAVAQVFRRNRE